MENPAEAGLCVSYLEQQSNKPSTSPHAVSIGGVSSTPHVDTLKADIVQRIFN